MRYVAVGVSIDDDPEKRQVAVCLGDMGMFYMNEEGSRKLVDDILRNANYLWPIKEEKQND